MDFGFIAIVGFVVGPAGGEVEGAGDFLIEEDVLHGGGDMGIESDGEFSDESGSFVGIENAFEVFRSLIGGMLNNLAVHEGEPNILEGDAVV